ncbi:hypothetical protein Trydic_g12653 [Trypoxylus dichotomus]
MECAREHEILFDGKLQPNYTKDAKERNTSADLLSGWTKLLILAGFATTIGLSLPVGYNIGVVNSPAEATVQIKSVGTICAETFQVLKTPARCEVIFMDYFLARGRHLQWIIKRFCNESIYGKYGYGLTDNQMNILWPTIVSIFLVGGTIGSLTGSWFADKVGRKGGLFCGAVLLIIGGILFFSTKMLNSVEVLIVARFVIGLAAGTVTCVMPMYLTELAPLHLRGAMGVMCPLGVTFGVLLSQVMSLRHVLDYICRKPKVLILVKLSN